MKTQQTNFCRQMTKQFSSKIGIPNFPTHNKQMLSHCIDLSVASEKFLLPSGGRLLDDKEFRALDELEPLNLPFPIIALEYFQHLENNNLDQTETSTKRIIFARTRDDYIVITPVCWFDSQGIWAPFPEIGIPITGYLDRRAAMVDGRVAIVANRINAHIPFSDYADELGAFLCFMNALQCQNVRAERVLSNKKNRKIKPSLPFDSYHILTINSQKGNSTPNECGHEHRHPREHLRRGHIRRLENKKIWVNATVVNAGIGNKLDKDYRLAA